MYPHRPSRYDFRAPTLEEVDRADARSQMERDPERCGCRGGGWISTNRDVWRKCGIHYDGQPHPESRMYAEERHSEERHAVEAWKETDECKAMMKQREKRRRDVEARNRRAEEEGLPF